MHGFNKIFKSFLIKFVFLERSLLNNEMVNNNIKIF